MVCLKTSGCTYITSSDLMKQKLICAIMAVVVLFGGKDSHHPNCEAHEWSKLYQVEEGRPDTLHKTAGRAWKRMKTYGDALKQYLRMLYRKFIVGHK